MGQAAVPLIALAISGASAGFQVSEAQAAKKQARRASDEQRRRQEGLQAEIRQRQEQEESELAQSRRRQAARRRQRALASGRQGRSSTIATSPLGAPGAAAPAAAKTLLGS